MFSTLASRGICIRTQSECRCGIETPTCGNGAGNRDRARNPTTAVTLLGFVRAWTRRWGLGENIVTPC
jgi:hypothetical protein